MKERKTILIIGLVILVLLVLLALPSMNSEDSNLAVRLSSTDIECLNGHQNLVMHHHPNLTINLDGEKDRIPAEIGITSDCMAEVHTHDSSGKLHVESTEPGKQLLLEDFFTVWDESLNRSGYELTQATANGQDIETPGKIILQDGVDIILNYEKSTSTTSN